MSDSSSASHPRTDEDGPLRSPPPEPPSDAHAQLAGPAFLPTLSDDELEAIGYLLADPLAPHLAVALSSCSRGLRRALEAPLRELKERRQNVEELCAKVGTSCDRLRGATDVSWGNRDLTAADMETLGMLLATSGLPQLQRIELPDNPIGDAGVQSLFGGLGRRALPELQQLLLYNNSFPGNVVGNAGAAALAAALSRGAMPALQFLALSNNRVGDEGMVALAPPLRKLPELTHLYLDGNLIAEGGLAALLAPGDGVLPKLHTFNFQSDDNHLNDTGCATLVTALDSGVMPHIDELTTSFDASDESKRAVLQAFSRARARRGLGATWTH